MGCPDLLEENLVLEMRTIQYEGRRPSVMMHDVDDGVVGPGNLSGLIG